MTYYHILHISCLKLCWFFYNQDAFIVTDVSCVHVKTHQLFLKIELIINLLCISTKPLCVILNKYKTTCIWFHFQNRKLITMQSFNGSKFLHNCRAIKANDVLKSVQNELQCAVLGVLLTPISLILVFLWKTTLKRNH